MPEPPTQEGPEGALERASRSDGARLLALLVRELRDFDLAEDALQEAYLAAARQWPEEGAPRNPQGWLLTIARRRGRDALRRRATLARKLPLLLTDAPPAEPGPEARPPAAEAHAIPDERLRLVFTSCHPALDRPAQLALTLRFVAGLGTRAVARLLLVSEATMAARITRAKRKIAVAGIPYRVPREEELPERLASVLAVLHLLFTEGYLPTSGERVVRPELCAEALRLARLVEELLPREPEVTALRALMVLHHARRDARAPEGRLVRLLDQDRGRWHWPESREGLALLERAAARDRPPGPYGLEARIAAQHAVPDPDATDWGAIAALYARLEGLRPGPAVRLARAVAVAEADGPAAALRLLEGLDAGPARSPQLPAVRAELLLRLGRLDEALLAYDEALVRATNGAVRAHLAERRAAAAG